MKQKIKSIIVLLFLSIFILGISNSVQATPASPGKKLNIKFLRESGYGYQLANSRKTVWKIYEVDNDMGQTIYCLKGGPGFGDAFDSAEPAPGSEKQQTFTYDQYFNLRAPDDIAPDTYRNALPKDTSKYTSLMWILDNIYVPAVKNASDEETQRAEENKTNLLEAAKSYADEKSIMSNPEDIEYLTDDDIDAVQQLAIWYFTNEDENYHISDKNISFYLNSAEGVISSEKKPLSDTVFNEGWERDSACKALFKYLVSTAEAKTEYNYKTVSETNPVELENTEIKVTKQDGRLIIGPYKLKETNNGATYTIEAKVTNGSGSNVEGVKYLEDNKSTEINDIKTVVGQDFYISVPENTDIKNIKLELSIKLYVRTINYWSETNPDPSKNQPVVIVENKILPFTLEKTYEHKIFDLSLRKFITTIESEDEQKKYQRVPDVKVEELVNGTDTTATYEHSKKPIGVLKGDIVTYTIRVYNEGEIDGYVTSIKDHIPLVQIQIL